MNTFLSDCMYRDSYRRVYQILPLNPDFPNLNPLYYQGSVAQMFHLFFIVRTSFIPSEIVRN